MSDLTREGGEPVAAEPRRDLEVQDLVERRLDLPKRGGSGCVVRREPAKNRVGERPEAERVELP